MTLDIMTPAEFLKADNETYTKEDEERFNAFVSENKIRYFVASDINTALFPKKFAKLFDNVCSFLTEDNVYYTAMQPCTKDVNIKEIKQNYCLSEYIGISERGFREGEVTLVFFKSKFINTMEDFFKNHPGFKVENKENKCDFLEMLLSNPEMRI